MNISQGGKKSKLEAVLGSGRCPAGQYNTERSVLEQSEAGVAAVSEEVMRNHNSPLEASQGKKVRLSTFKKLPAYGISGHDEILRSGVPALPSDQDLAWLDLGVSNDQDPMRLGSGVSSQYSASLEGARVLVESDSVRSESGEPGGGPVGKPAEKSSSEPLYKCRVESDQSMSSIESPLMKSLLQIAAETNARKALPELVRVSTGERKMPERPQRQESKQPQIKERLWNRSCSKN